MCNGIEAKATFPTRLISHQFERQQAKDIKNQRRYSMTRNAVSNVSKVNVRSHICLWRPHNNVSKCHG